MDDERTVKIVPIYAVCTTQFFVNDSDVEKSWDRKEHLFVDEDDAKDYIVDEIREFFANPFVYRIAAVDNSVTVFERPDDRSNGGKRVQFKIHKRQMLVED